MVFFNKSYKHDFPSTIQSCCFYQPKKSQNQISGKSSILRKNHLHTSKRLMRNQVLVLGQRAVETLEDIQATARRGVQEATLSRPQTTTKNGFFMWQMCQKICQTKSMHNICLNNFRYIDIDMYMMHVYSLHTQSKIRSHFF